MDCPKLTYHITAEHRLRCVYNADGGRKDYACKRRNFGHLKKYTFPNGVETTRPYTNYGSPLTIKTSKSGINFVNASFDPDILTLTYNIDERPKTINKSGKTATFSYNHTGERTKMTVTGGSNPYTRIYLGGNYEREVSGNTTTERLYLGGTPYSAPAVAIRTGNGAWQLHYIHRDYLGSIVAITNSSTTNAPVETNSYDAWGRLRNPSTLQSFAYNAQPTLLLRRGYTGHEHLPEFGLINMNARLYDPVVGRFMSPDPYVQATDFSQSFNRYAYCWNNPLIYTDPSGEFIFTVLAAIFCPPLLPVAIGADIFGIGNTAAHAMKGDIHNTGDFLKYYGQGAIVGASLVAAWQYTGPAYFAQGTGSIVSGSSYWATKAISTANFIHKSMSYYTWIQYGTGILGMIATENNDNAGKLFLGNFYLDENSWFGGIWKGFSRHMQWEMLNTFSGHFYTQMRNINGKVDRVEYDAGVTYAISENVKNMNGWEGVSLGNFSAVKLKGSFTTFDADDVFWHEFGHTKDSRLFGPLYLPIMGLFSGWDWMRELTGGWTENWAVEYSKRYRKRRGIPF